MNFTYALFGFFMGIVSTAWYLEGGFKRWQ